jgi:hypothetical protein
VSGVQLAQGLGVRQARGFWQEAWSQVLRRPVAVMGLSWLSLVLLMAIMAPYLASGHPIVARTLDASGAVTRTTSPLWDNVLATDLLLPAGALGVLLWAFAPARPGRALHIAAAALAGLALLRPPLRAHRWHSPSAPAGWRSPAVRHEVA